MPRTKVNKTAKRNRDKDEAMKERLREFDVACDEELTTLDAKCIRWCEEFNSQLNLIKSRLQLKFLQMNVSDITNATMTKANKKLSEDSVKSISNISVVSGSVQSKKSRDDEGYLTEDSTTTGLGQRSVPQVMGRTPGPLSLAKARGRRSRSACGYLNSAIKAKPSAVPHSARSRLRTPQATPRVMTKSVDRAPITPKYTNASPPAVYRWPKPGEIIISLSGSPVVSQMTPEIVANVNIPIRNGMLSLRPKKMEGFDENTFNDIDSETIKQIKQLQSNLSYIMGMAERNGIRKHN